MNYSTRVHFMYNVYNAASGKMDMLILQSIVCLDQRSTYDTLRRLGEEHVRLYFCYATVSR